MVKKFVITLMLVCLIFITACSKNPNAELANKLGNHLKKIEKNISNIEEITEADFLSQELLEFQLVQETFYYNTALMMKDEEFVFAKETEKQQETKNEKQQEQAEITANPETQTRRNVNTYFENRFPRNVNTYFLPPHMPYALPGGYGGYGMGYGGFGGVGGIAPMPNGGVPPYGQNYPGVYNTMPYDVNNQTGLSSTNKRQPNVNTFGLGIKNIDTYKNAQQQNEIYNKQEDGFTAQIKLNKLNAIYASAAHLSNVNSDVFNIKDKIFLTIETLKDAIKQLEKAESQLSKEQIKSIEILLDSINNNITKIELAKNQLNYEINKIKALKENFLTNNNELSARYILLANLLDTRYSYYSNISNCLQDILFKVTLHTQNPYKLEDDGIAENKISQKNENKTTKPLDENKKENITIKDNDILIENITIEKAQQNTAPQNQQSLQNQLEQSWQNNFKRNQEKNEENLQNFNNNINKNNLNEITQNEEINQNEESIEDGFKAVPTPKEQVGAEPIVATSASTKKFLTNEEAEQIEKMFPSQIPFKKPQKNDFMNICPSCF